MSSRDPNSVEARAIRSLLDVVEELAQGLANGQTPDPAWAETVSEAFASHRRELATGEREVDA